MSASKPISFFGQQFVDYIFPYPVSVITFCLKEVHHGKVVTGELSDQSQQESSTQKLQNSFESLSDKNVRFLQHIFQFHSLKSIRASFSNENVFIPTMFLEPVASFFINLIQLNRFS